MLLIQILYYYVHVLHYFLCLFRLSLLLITYKGYTCFYIYQKEKLDVEFKKSSQNLNLGEDYFVWFSDKRLTLDKGVMRKGGVLPPSISLVNPLLERVPFKIGRKKTILTVPSLDTPVCEWQVKSLSNDLKLNGYDEDHEWYIVSVDTPFAQARFIKENNIDKNIIFLSDYSEHRFMSDSGLRIQELNIYTRAVITCDSNNMVIDVVIPQDITHLP